MDPRHDSSCDFLDAVAAGLPTSWDWRQPVLVAVSGGADSMALLHGLVTLGQRIGVNIAALMRVAHIEYDLRPTATRDRKFVQEQAAALGVICHWQRLPVKKKGSRRSGEGIEAAARRLRYQFFTEVAGECGARHVAVGHTRDDQAETILHRVLRGTGLNGLAGMPQSRQLVEGISLVRPLLRIRRQRVRGYLDSRGLVWKDDESNENMVFSRNFIRHCLLSEAEQGPYQAATEALARLGDQAGEYAAQRADAVEQVIASGVCCDADGAVLVSRLVATEVGRNVHLLADVLLEIWRQQGWPRQELSHRHLRKLASMCLAGETKKATELSGVDLPGGIRAICGPEGLLLSRNLARVNTTRSGEPAKKTDWRR